jgi:UDP-N-acetylglucosamine 1-carboxyvinyltransferase
VAEDSEDVLHVVGGKPLNGTIKVRGAKNFVSKAMVAALLAPGVSVLKNVPEIRDVHVVSDLLRLHGVNVDVNGDKGIVTIDATNVQLADVADVDTLSGSSRIPILFSGPLLHRLGEAFIPQLGGCNIGGRPIDFHLETLRKLGANVDKEHQDGIHITAPGRTAWREDSPAIPLRRRDRADAARRCARRRQDRAIRRGNRAGDHGSGGGAAENGRHHLG